jgi:aminopeptidase N
VTGIETLKKLEDYTGIKFPINKMEQFGVPSGYFYNHAMENYGLVIYGEEHLLRNNQSSEEDIKRTTVYISHEFAHMWFGNLVTPVWWDHLWLSESFAAYFQYFMASQIKPDWELMDQFLVDVFNKAMYEEEFSQAAPLNYKITRIGQYPPFHIMYEKGASIIRMMTHFLTPEVFKKGLHIYLNNMKFRNSMPSDLYNGFQQAVDEVGVKSLLGNYSVSDILTTWDSSKGYPKLTVTRDYTTGSITIQQEDAFKNEPKASWVIPINYVFSAEGKIDFSQTTADFWINKDTEVLTNDYPTDGWLILNKQQFGYYRVNYDIENWNRIIDYMNTENFANIHPLNRAQLIDDAFNFAYNGKIPYDIPLRLCDYLTRERHYVPLVTFYEAISSYIFIYSYGVNDHSEYKYFKNYTLTNTISPTTDHLSETDVFTQYIKNTLQGVHDYYKNKPAATDSHIDKLGRAKFRRYRYYFKD